MALGSPDKYSDEEIEDARSGKKNAQSVIDGRRGLEDADKSHEKGSSADSSQRAELDVLKLLNDVRKNNPYLSQNHTLEKRINDLEEAVNPREQAKIKDDISSILSNTYSHVIKDKSRELYFRNHADQWTQKVKTLNIKEQVQWIENIDQETEKRKAPFEALKQSLEKVDGLSGAAKEAIYKDFSEYMANNGRRDNEKYAQNFQKNVDNFNSLSGKLTHLSSSEKAKMAKDFLNVSSAQQETELKKLTELTETQDLDEKFKQFSPDRQKKQTKFNTLSRAEKTQALKELTRELTDEYRQTYQGSTQYLTQQDVKLFDQTAKGGDIGLLEMCLKDMPRVVKDAQQTYKEGEKLLLKFATALGKEKAKAIFDSVDWNGSQTTSFDRKKIIDAKSLDKIFASNELGKREENNKAFERKIDSEYADKKKGHNHSLMHKKGREANKAWFKKLSTGEQTTYLKKGSDIERSLKKRQKINKTHADFPDSVQREMYNVFENLGMEEREKLNKKIDRQRRENSKKYSKQLKKAGKEDLIPSDPKSRQILEAEFDDLSLKDQGERKEKDKTIFNPELKAAVGIFKQSFAKVQPSSVFMEAWQEFQKLPQPNQRINFIKNFLLQNDAEGNDELNKQLVSLGGDEMDQLGNKEFRSKIADKTAENAEEELENGNNIEAAALYQEALNMDPERDDLRMVAEVMEESAYKDAIVPPSVMEDGQADFDALMDNEDTQQTLKDLLLAQQALDALAQSERSHQNLGDAEDRSMDALKQTGNKDAVELQEDISAYEDEKALKDKVVLTNEGGNLKTENVIQVKFGGKEDDLNKTDGASKANRKEVAKKLKANDGKNKGLDTLQMTNDQGQNQKAEEAEGKHDQMLAAQQQAIVDILVNNMLARNVPAPIAERAARQIVARQFDKEMNKYSYDELAT